MDKNLSDILEIRISNDFMSAEMNLKPVDDSVSFEVEDIVAALNENGVIAGINTCEIENIINKKNYNEFVEIAKGAPATEGSDGYYVFKFDSAPSKKPRLLQNGSVDYYNLNIVTSVEAGELLAEYIPKKDGMNGINIKGQIVPAKKSKDLPQLRGTGFSCDDDGKYYASIAGKVELNMGQLMVLPIYTITGDVDLSVGNIDFKGDLEIFGSIKSGMTVKATGNITVNKLIEAAYVQAGKEILVRGGILGGGKAQISSVGNIFAQFIENATINSGSSVQADSIVNSNITAYKDVNIFGKTSTIVGGSLKANRRVKTKYIGSETGVKTTIEVGVDSSILINLKHMAEEIEEEQNNLDKIEQTLKLYMEKEVTDNKLYMQLVRTKIEKSAHIFKLREVYEQVKRRVEIGRYAEVIAEKRVYPGVRLCIDGKYLIVENEYEQIVFKRKGDKILSKRYVDEDYADEELTPTV